MAPIRSVWSRRDPPLEDLPRVLATDPEIVCMTEVLAALMKLQAVKGVRARERALHWVMHRLGEEDNERAEQAKPFE